MIHSSLSNLKRYFIDFIHSQFKMIKLYRFPE